MIDELKELSKIVDWVYEKEPTGVDMLSVEAVFDEIFNHIINMEKTEKELFEFL